MRLREMSQLAQSVTNFIIQVLKRQATIEQRTRLLEQELVRRATAGTTNAPHIPSKQSKRLEQR